MKNYYLNVQNHKIYIFLQYVKRCKQKMIFRNYLNFVIQ